MIGQALALRIAGGAALVLAIACGVQSWRLHSLQAEHAAVAANNTLLEAAVESWQHTASDQALAAGSWKDVADKRLALLAAAQAETLRIGNANQDALRRALVQLEQADKARAVAEGKLAGARMQPDCAAALTALNSACPTLEGF